MYDIDDSRDSVLNLLEKAISSNSKNERLALAKVSRKEADSFKRKVCLEKEATWYWNRVVKPVGLPWSSDVLKDLLISAKEGEKGAFEGFVKGLLVSYEFYANLCSGIYFPAKGQHFDDEIFRMVEEICSRFNPGKKGAPYTHLFLEEEELYHIATCEMLLIAGVGFFTVDGKEVVKRREVVRRDDKQDKQKSIPIGEALAVLLQYAPATIRNKFKKIDEANKLWLKNYKIQYPDVKKRNISLKESPIKRNDKHFIKKLESLFKEHINRSGKSKFNFLTEKINPTPEGILTYLIENII